MRRAEPQTNLIKRHYDRFIMFALMIIGTDYDQENAWMLCPFE